MSLLFEPLELGPVRLPNRIIVAPMCQYSAAAGRATEWHRMHLGQLALSGAGLLILEATAVEPGGRITHADLGLWDRTTEVALASVLGDVRLHSSMPLGIQLAHAGRKASSALPWEGGGTLSPDSPEGWQTVSASSEVFQPQSPYPPHALDKGSIAVIVEQFAEAATRAARLGFEVIEIHAAHGYLLHQFLSPLSNRRNDPYGGPLENRMRLTLQVYDAVRQSVPAQMAVGVRISATDWVDGGWDLEQSIILAEALDERGASFIHVSSGGLSPRQQIPVTPGYQVPFAEAIKAKVRMPVIAVGLITEPQQAEDILEHHQADAVALARGMLYDPRWPWHAAATLGASVPVPVQYRRGVPHDLQRIIEK